MPLLQVVPEGLYCPAADFFIDPWKPVSRAVITHAHSDHARWGSQRYLAAASGEAILRMRLGREANIRFIPYGEVTSVNGVEVSLHPAGHITGSAQIRVAYRGEVWVVTGDYKLQSDATCNPLNLCAATRLSPNQLSVSQFIVGNLQNRSLRKSMHGGVPIKRKAEGV